jgi:DNA-binding transcriptional ArsR family regulator
MDGNEMQADFFRVLANPLRIRILYALREKKGCVTDLSRYIQEPQPQVSRALIALKRAGLVFCKKTGTLTCYRIKSDGIFKILAMAKEILKRENSLLLKSLGSGEKDE